MLPADPRMPHLTTAWNSAAMGSALAGLLRNDTDAGYEIDSCKLERFRYRRGERAILLYRLGLRDRKGAPAGRHWVTGNLFRGNKARKLYRSLRSSALPADPSKGRGGLAPLSYLSDLEMLVQSFPLDRHLPALAPLVNRADRDLDNRLLRISGNPREGEGTCSLHPVRYRPGIGATLEARCKSSAGVSLKSVFVKVRRPDAAGTLRNAAEALAYWSNGRRNSFRLCLPQAYVKESQIVLYGSAEGVALETLLAGSGDLAAPARQLALALASWQQSDAPLIRCRSRKQVLRRAITAADFLAWGHPALDRLIAEILEGIAAWDPETHLVPAHLDLKPDHIFFSPDAVGFIDIDSCAAANPALDPALLLARLSALSELSSLKESRIRCFSRTFLEHYRAQVPSAFLAGLGPAYACAALKVALYFLQHLEKDWPQRCEETLLRARRALAGDLL